MGGRDDAEVRLHGAVAPDRQHFTVLQRPEQCTCYATVLVVAADMSERIERPQASTRAGVRFNHRHQLVDHWPVRLAAPDHSGCGG